MNFVLLILTELVMKNKLIILLLLLLTGSIKTNAQDYIPMLGDTNVWTYAHWSWEWVDIISTEDSVYNGLTYKKILHEGWGLTGLIKRRYNQSTNMVH